jgi:hypothetical protein
MGDTQNILKEWTGNRVPSCMATSIVLRSHEVLKTLQWTYRRCGTCLPTTYLKTLELGPQMS